MGINERIQECLIRAQRSGDKIRLSAIRLLKSAIRYEEDAKRHKLDDNEFISLVAKLIKQRHESIELFKKGKRDDLVQKEEAEIKVLQEFLPPQLSRDELLKLVDEALNEVQASTIKDMGRVMKLLMPRVRGRAQAEVVKNLVTERLLGTTQSG